MSDFNTFSGKTVDDAISEACRFFAVEREKLEVEIVSGGSTGIFGLVGKKKAQIKARRRRDAALAALEREQEARAARQSAAGGARPEHAGSARQDQEGRSSRQRGEEHGGEGRERPARPSRDDARADSARNESARADTFRGEAARDHAASADAARDDSGLTPLGDEDSAGASHDEDARTREPRQGRERGRRGRGGRQERTRREQPARSVERQSGAQTDDNGRLHDDDLPEGQDHSPASEELLAAVKDIMARLLTPILEAEPAMEVEGTASRVNVSILDEEHSGLLIGREGQTLAALQYLANRILARRWETPVRVQINTGEYREKQDESLRRMALYLADKARDLGRPQSTKPLSSYHRRVIHLTLQDDETIQTRSKGEGPMKRVIIVPRRSKGQPRPVAVEADVQEESRQAE